MTTDRPREKLGSRLGFLFLAAACAIGLGNIWRFPFVTGQNGGAIFVLFYILFLAILGFPILIMELSLGRAAQRNLAGAYRVLATPDSKFKWQKPGYVFFAGNLLLMMFYTTVSGWLLAYTWTYINGSYEHFTTPESVRSFFSILTGDTANSILYMGLTVLIGTTVCASGLRCGVESVIKVMMTFLLFMLVLLTVKALTMPGAPEALKFYLAPNLEPFRTNGELSAAKIIRMLYAAMGQAFFTLSLGIGSMAVFGSYINKEHSLTKESIWIIVLDTSVALLAGLIIFPICFSFNISTSGGPGLIFVTLPNIFSNMNGGHYWGMLFFLFMSLAAMTTVIAVFENIIAFLIDELRFRRTTAALLVGSGVFVLSLPCTLGFSVWSSFQPLGPGTSVLDLEDFIISQNLLPLGAFFLLLFCVTRHGWGWKNFLTEADTGSGLKFPRFLRRYVFYILPILILLIFLLGYLEKFAF